jgi:hypothetical protein
MSSIYIPGRGELTWEQIRIDRAVKEYDERLFFARNAVTGDWCVYIKMPFGEPPFPVLGFGATTPPVNVILERLKKGDTLKNGEKIYNGILKSQEDYRKKFVSNADEARDESVEVVEHFLRKNGKSPVIKEFISKSIPKGGEASDA